MKRKLVAPVIAVGAASLLLAIMFAGGRLALADVLRIMDTSINDFNGGTLYHTELEPRDDGSVSLQEVGLAGAWRDTTSTGLPPRLYHTSPRVGNFIYAIGGTDNVNVLRTAYVSQIQAAVGHGLSAWTPVTTLPVGLLAPGSAAVTVNGTTYIYVIGGFSDTNFRDVPTVYRATVNTSNGSLSSWTTSTTWDLPLPLDHPGVTTVNGFIYVIGGGSNNGAYSGHSYYTRPNADGSLSGWAETTPLPGNFSDGVAGHVVSSYSDGQVSKVYLATGLTASHGVVPDVYSATADPATGVLSAWVANANYQRNLVYTAGAVYGTDTCGANIFLSGGVTNQGGTLQDYVAAAPLAKPDYLAGGWYDTSALVVARQGHTMVASSDGWLYVIGGGDSNGNPVTASVVRFGETACAAAGGATRAPSGTFTSRVLNLALSTTIYTLTWNTSITAGVPITLSFSYRYSNYPDFHDVQFSNPVYATSGISHTTEAVISSTAQYLQYKVTLARDDSVLTQTPYLNWVQAFYEGRPPPTATPAGPTPTPPPPVPDLIASSIEMTAYGGYRPSTDHPIRFVIGVKNIGFASAPPGHYEVDAFMHLTRPPQPGDTSDSFGSVDLAQPLQPGQAVAITTNPITAGGPGRLTLYGWANRNRYIPELSYTNDTIGPMAGCINLHDGQSFTDVHAGPDPPQEYFYIPVEYLTCIGAISGYADHTFRPYNNTTRAQFTKMTSLAVGWTISTPPGGSYTFADVPTTFPFFAFVETAYSHGVISGYGCGGVNEPCDAQRRPYFRPNANINRGQLAKIIALAKGWTLANPSTPTFRDVPTTSPYYQFVETVSAQGVVSGYGCGTGCREYRPANSGTRGQLSKMLYIAVTQQ